MGNLHPQKQQNAAAPRLGFHEIVPGYDGEMPLDHNAESSIPKFDLSRQLLVDERRESAARRQGPGQKRESVQVNSAPIGSAELSPEEGPALVSSPRAESRVSAYRHPVIQRYAIVEDIVRRDIERLCMAPKTA